MVERTETVELRRFSLRQLLALVFVAALFLAVCPVFEVGIVHVVLGCLAWVCDVYLRQSAVLEKVRPWARLTSAGFFVGAVFAIHYLWAKDPSPQMASPVGDARQLLFSAPSAEVLIRLVFAIPVAILGYCLIVSPAGLLSHVRSQRRWQVAIAVAPALGCLAICFAIWAKLGIPSNVLACLVIVGLLGWCVVLAVKTRWSVAIVLGAAVCLKPAESGDTLTRLAR